MSTTLPLETPSVHEGSGKLPSRWDFGIPTAFIPLRSGPPVTVMAM